MDIAVHASARQAARDAERYARNGMSFEMTTAILKVYCIILLQILITACTSTGSNRPKSSADKSSSPKILRTKSTVTDRSSYIPATDAATETEASFVENPFHPIVVNGELLGGFDKRKPVKPEDFKADCNGRLVSYEEFCCEQESDDSSQLMSPDCDLLIDLVKGGETFKLYDFFSDDNEPFGILIDGQYSGAGKGGITNYSYASAGFDFYHLQVEREHAISREIKPEITVSINGDWEAIPRPVIALGNDEFAVDIDSDGKLDRIQIFKSLNSFEISGYTKSPRQKGKIKVVVKINGFEHILNEIEIDGIYTRSYALALIDIDNDAIYEFVEVAKGHDRYIWVSELNFETEGTVTSRYLFDHEVTN